MWPTITQLDTAMGPMPVNVYGIAMMLAFSGAFALIHLRAKRFGIDPDKLPAGYVAAAVGGMLGARLLYAFSVDLDRTIADPMSLLSCSGFAVYGGILGGALGVGMFVAGFHLPPWRTADLAAPGVVIGMGIGRIGCFFAGCCHGVIAPTPQNPIGLFPSWFTGGQLWLSSTPPFLTAEFHGGVGRIHDIPLYPTQLWSVGTLIPLALFLVWFWPRRKFDGQIAAITLLVEPPLRALFESFRADERGYWLTWPVSEQVAAWLPPGMSKAGESMTAHIAGITTSQGIALVLMACGLAIWVARRNTGVAAAPAPGPVADDADLLEELA